MRPTSKAPVSTANFHRTVGLGINTNHGSYLSGNFSPIHQTVPLTPCSYQGIIPDELSGGEYVRNGSNPVSNEDLGRDAHWFDGDGMLSGVSFRKRSDGRIEPEFVNKYVLTDLYLSTITSRHLKRPILPSIATLVNPLASLLTVTIHILRTVFLVILSFLPGSKQAIKKISVANTAIYYHDGRALATCESGPPMRIALPGLETVGWYNGNSAQGEERDLVKAQEEVLGGEGPLSWMREWTTAHPKVDPRTNEMILFHATFLAPYVRYSVIPSTESATSNEKRPVQKLRNSPVPGISGAKMMHDFGASTGHTIIMDLPLSLDPLNMAKGKPVIEYDNTKPARFAVFPRHNPAQTRYFETAACCIFHTANTWDDVNEAGFTDVVHMLACRLTSSTLVFAAGNIAGPEPKKIVKSPKKKGISWFAKYDAGPSHHSHAAASEEESLISGGTGRRIFEISPDLESPQLVREPLIRMRSNGEIDKVYSSVSSYVEDIEEDEVMDEEEQCRLYHYAFSLKTGHITSQYALSAIPFEFPSVHPDLEMQEARYVYGCSTTVTSFNAALGKATKINALAKVDSKALISRGEALTKQGKLPSVTGCVDTRGASQVLRSSDSNDPIRIFRCPDGWFVQEPRFVPRHNATAEDDGFLLTYAFNEGQLDADGEVPPDEDLNRRAKSEFWIIDARDMKTIVGRVELPQRVPYGLHGSWFSEEQIRKQRPIDQIRTIASPNNDGGLWMGIRDALEKMLS